jgi:hypothetical protein
LAFEANKRETINSELSEIVKNILIEGYLALIMARAICNHRIGKWT